MERNKSSATGDAGTSLVELLIVLAILGLAALAAPALLSSARPGLAVKAAATRLASDLVAARAAAIDSDREQILRFDIAGRTYITANDKHVALPGEATWRLSSVDGAIVERANHTIRFYPDGSSTGGAIEIRFRGRTYRIVDHWLTGRVSIDDLV